MKDKYEDIRMQWTRLKFSLLTLPLRTLSPSIMSTLVKRNSIRAVVDVPRKVQSMDEVFRILLHDVRSHPDMVPVLPLDVLQGSSLVLQSF